MFETIKNARKRMILNPRYLLGLTMLLLIWSYAPVIGDDHDSILGPPPGSYKILSESGEIKIPFELFRGDIRFTGQVNGREVRMLIDNGFLWDQILLFGSPLIDSLGLKYDGEIEVGGSGEGDPVMSKTASGITIAFPGVEFHDQTAIITPYSSGLSNMWWGAEGQVSATFLKHFVVEFNFDEMVMTLTKPEKFQYRGEGTEIPMKPLPGGPWSIPAVLTLSDSRVVSLDLAMDLGYGDQLEIAVNGDHGLTVPEKALPGSLGFGVQGETLGHFGRVAAVEIGGFRLENVLAGFIADDHAGSVFHEITVGLSLLQRFNFIYDYPGRRMFIEPGRRFADPFEYNMSGMSMRKGAGDYLEIIRIHPESPAEKVGLQVGDRVTQIDDRRAASYDTWELRPLLRKEGRVVNFEILRDGSKINVPIKLRRLI